MCVRACVCPLMYNFWGSFLSNPLSPSVPHFIQRAEARGRRVWMRCARAPCNLCNPAASGGAFQDGSSGENGLSESCWSLLATSVKSVCVHLLECNQQKFGWSQIPDIQTWQFLTHVTWETPRKVFCCGTALMDCSMHQCWAASRPSAVSASGFNLKDSPPAMDFLDLSRSPKAAWANFQP